MGASQNDHVLPGRDDVTAGGGEAPSSAPSAVTPPTGRMTLALESINLNWSRNYHLAACTVGRAEVWTGLAERADEPRVIFASAAGVFADLIRHDAAMHPARPAPVLALPDSLLDRCRARHPGWAIVVCGDGIVAARGHVVIGPAAQGIMGSLIGEAEMEAIRLMALLARH